MRGRALSALVALLAASAAHAEDWHPLGSTDDADWAADRDSLSVSGDVVTFRVEEKFFRPQPDGTVRAVTRVWVDCRARTHGALGGEEYDAAGRLVTSWSTPERLSSPIEPDTPAAGFADFACAPTAAGSRH